MSDDAGKPRNRAFSSHSYMLALLLTILVVFAITAGTVVNSVREVRAVTEAEARHDAEQELQQAIANVFASADVLGKDLASWGEVHQQLQNPQYYNYWREQRLVSARQYPDYVKGIELYDADGAALAQVTGSALPNQRGSEMRYVQRIGGQTYLVTFTAVGLQGGNGEALGYVGTLWEFIPALLLHHFSSLDVESLAELPGSDIRLPAERAEDLLHFAPHQIPGAEKLEQAMLDSLFEFAAVLGVLLVLVYLGVSRLFVRPLQQMVKHLNALRGAGDNAPEVAASYLVDSRLQEIDTLADALHRYHEQLVSTTRDLDETNQELWTLAHIDPLTGAHNRRAFDHDWRSLVETASEQRLHIAFLLFDCDFFKAINDTYGHTIGDRLIQSLARLLQKALRKGDKLYRLGGDEFAAVLLNADAQQAQLVAERCLKLVREEPFDAIGIQEPVRISVGLAVSTDTHRKSLNQLPRHADLAMYHAKRDQHHKIIHYRSSMDATAGSVVSSRAVNAAVDAAHGRGGIEMHYQPIISTSTGQVAHYEALVRVRDEQGPLYPGDILPVIDQRALQVPFDLSVIQAIYADLEKRHLPKGVGVGLNLSAHSLLLPSLVEHLAPLFPLLDRHPLIVEVTETDLITQMQHVSENLTRLREQGALIALDDFGSGYSSIRYLAGMPVDIVKFDIEMIRDLEGEPGPRSVVENAARMVREAGYQLIAEGIETTAQQELATSMGATHLQGYLFGKPCRSARPATVAYSA